MASSMKKKSPSSSALERWVRSSESAACVAKEQQVNGVEVSGHMAADGRTDDDAAKANRAATDRRGKRKADDPYEGSFGRYMELKVQKLREQFHDEATVGMHSEEEGQSNSSCLFRGISIHVNGYTKPTHQELRQLMVRHGGMFENYYSRSRVTHIICSNLPDGKIKELRSEKNPPPVVRPEWVTDSIAAGKLLPYGSYQLQRLLFAHPGQRTLTESIIPRTPLGSGWPRVEEVGHSEQPQAVGSSWEACPSSTADTGLTGAAASDGRPPSSSVIMTGMQNDPLCHSVAAACSIPDEVQAKQDAARMVDLSVLEGHLLAMKPPQLQTGLQNGRLSVDGPLTSISSVQDKLSVPSSVHDGPRQLTAACGSSPDDSAIRSLFPNGSTTTAVRGQPGTMATHSSLQMSHGEKLEKVVGEIWPTPSCPQRSAEQSLNGWNRYKDGERVTVCDDARHFPRQGTADMCRLVEQSVPLGSSDSSSRGLLIEKPAEMLDGWHGGAVSVPSGMSEAEQPLGCAAANGKGPLLKEAEQGLFDSRTVLMGAGENSCAIGHVDGRTMFGEDVQRNDKGAVRAGEERGNGGGSDDLIGNQEEETKGAIGSTGGTGTAAGQRGPPLVPPEPSVQRSSGKIPDPKTSHSTQSDPNFIQNYYKNSRLHFIGTWRNRYREPTEREENGEEKPANQKAGVERGPEPMAPARAGQISGHIDGRVIIHVDMDCFFVSVVIRTRPELQGKPVAVCHSSSAKGTGDISSANYEARKFGISAGMYVRSAKKLCPELVIVPYDFEAYEKVSDQLYSILHSNSNIVQAISCDEAFIDTTGLGDPEAIALKIRREIEEMTGCTASAGISHNMLLARMATRRAKPNNQYYLHEDEAEEFISELEVSDLPGVGWSLKERLKAKGINLCKELRRLSKEALQREFGVKTGDMLWAYARGIDHREVKCVQERKSIGAEVNWGVRFTKEEDAHTFLSNLAEEVCGRLSSAQLKGRTFTLKVKKRKPGAPEPMKFMGCGICDNISKSTTLGIGTDNAEVVLRVIRQLFKSLNLDPVEVRGLGLQVTKLMPSKGSSAALPFSADPSKKAAEGLQFTSEESPVPSKDFKDAGAAKHLEAHEPSKPPLRTVQDFFTMKRREDEKSLTSTDATKAKSESGMREGVNCVTLPEKWTTLSRGVEHLSMGSGRFNELSNADSMALGGSIVNAQDDCLQVQGGGSLGCNTKQPREDSAHQVQSINEAMGYGMEEMVMDEAEVLKEECTTITEEHAIGNNRPGLKSSDHRYPEGEDSACRMGNIRAHARPLENLAQVQYTDEAGAGGESRAEDMVAGKGKSLKGNRRTAMEEDVTDCLGEKVGNHSCREENEPDSEQRVGAWRVHAKAPESLPGAAGNQQERTGYPMVIPQAGNLMRPKGLEDLSIISGEPQLSRGAQMQQEIDQKEAQTEVMPRDEERREGDKPYRSCVDEAVKRNTHSGKAAVEEQRAQHLDRATQSCSPRHFTGDCTREAEAGGTSGFRRETHDDGSWQAPAVQQDGGVVTPASAGRGSSWLPPISQLDKSVLADLPPDLIAEIEQEYDRSRTTGSRSSAAHERTMAEKEHTIGAAAELERKTHPSVEGMSISQVDIGILKELPDMLQQEIVDNLSSHRGRDTGEETAAKRLQTDDQHGSRNGVDAHKDDGMGGPLDPAGQDAQERGQERIDALPPASQLDQTVLDALPLVLRRELEHAYEERERGGSSSGRGRALPAGGNRRGGPHAVGRPIVGEYTHPRRGRPPAAGPGGRTRRLPPRFSSASVAEQRALQAFFKRLFKTEKEDS